MAHDVWARLIASLSQGGRSVARTAGTAAVPTAVTPDALAAAAMEPPLLLNGWGIGPWLFAAFVAAIFIYRAAVSVSSRTKGRIERSVTVAPIDEPVSIRVDGYSNDAAHVTHSGRASAQATMRSHSVTPVTTTSKTTPILRTVSVGAPANKAVTAPSQRKDAAVMHAPAVTYPSASGEARAPIAARTASRAPSTSSAASVPIAVRAAPAPLPHPHLFTSTLRAEYALHVPDDKIIDELASATDDVDSGLGTSASPRDVREHTLDASSRTSGSEPLSGRPDSSSVGSGSLSSLASVSEMADFFDAEADLRWPPLRMERLRSHGVAGSALTSRGTGNGNARRQMSVDAAMDASRCREQQQHSQSKGGSIGRHSLSSGGHVFQSQMERGLTSASFDLSENVRSGDSRQGLDGEDEVLSIMRTKRLSFDEARLEMTRSRMLKAGIDPATGLPLDRRFVSFGRS